jgi:hypothetical protein
VLAQDCRTPPAYRRGEGLVLFSSLDEAADRAAAIVGDYARHARAARTLAEDCFDSNKVLARVAAEAMA